MIFGGSWHSSDNCTVSSLVSASETSLVGYHELEAEEEVAFGDFGGSSEEEYAFGDFGGSSEQGEEEAPYYSEEEYAEFDAEEDRQQLYDELIQHNSLPTQSETGGFSFQNAATNLAVRQEADSCKQQ